MRMPNDYTGNIRKVNIKGVEILADEVTASRMEFNTWFEKNIECLWFQTRSLGWNYNDFVVHLLEVITVLQLRDKTKLPPSSPDEA